MINLLKAVARKMLSRHGYILNKVSAAADQTADIEVALSVILSVKGNVCIVQVGANDGRINDPIFRFVKNNPNRTRILLIEPQTFLIEFLQENYRFHPSKIIHNGAVGPEGRLDLYTVAKHVWPFVRTEYSAGWPSYRAPSGVTSTDRGHVERWIRRHARQFAKNDEAVEVLNVPSAPLHKIMEKYGFDKPDVIQIDVEGFDDEVIYTADIVQNAPYLINYESANLNDERSRRINEYLASGGYSQISDGGDTLAVLHATGRLDGR